MSCEFIRLKRGGIVRLSSIVAIVQDAVLVDGGHRVPCDKEDIKAIEEKVAAELGPWKGSELGV